MPYRVTNGNANYPFTPNDAGANAPGSFFGGSPESVSMEFIWRVKTWNLSTASNIVWFPFADLSSQHIALPAGASYNILAGANQFFDITLVPAYPDEEGISIGWRRTERKATIPPTDDESIPQSFSINWGPAGEWSADTTVDTVEIDGELELDSNFELAGTDGDISSYLTTDPTDAISMPTELHIKLRGAVIKVANLYMKEEVLTTFDESTWSAGTIVLEPIEFWPWEINGVPTYSTTTGEKLEDHRRLDTNGFPRTLISKIHETAA